MLSRRRAIALASANCWNGGRLEHLVSSLFLWCSTRLKYLSSGHRWTMNLEMTVRLPRESTSARCNALLQFSAQDARCWPLPCDSTALPKFSDQDVRRRDYGATPAALPKSGDRKLLLDWSRSDEPALLILLLVAKRRTCSLSKWHKLPIASLAKEV